MFSVFGSCTLSVCHFAVNESSSLILIWLLRLLNSEVVNEFESKMWDSSHLSIIWEILSCHVGKPNSLRLSSILHAIFGRLPLGFDINLHQNFTAFTWSLIYSWYLPRSALIAAVRVWRLTPSVHLSNLRYIVSIMS